MPASKNLHITRSQFIDPFVGAFFIDKTSRLYE